MNKNLLYFIICLLLFAGLKFGYRFLSAEHLQFLLMPTNFGVKIITGSGSVFYSHAGYFFPQLDIVIDKSCSGYNFMLICFLMTSFVLLKADRIKNYLIIPVSFILSYLVTIFANISRISTYVIVIKRGIPDFLQFNAIHQAEGILVYLSFLVLTYFSLNFIISKMIPNSKMTDK